MRQSSRLRTLLLSIGICSAVLFNSCTGCGGGERHYSAASRSEKHKKDAPPKSLPKPQASDQEFHTSKQRVVIPMKQVQGVYQIEVSINGTPMNFIFDTGASVLSISNVEASYLLKQGRISTADIIGESKFIDANGDVSVGTMLLLREVSIGSRTLHNVEASVVNNTRAPLLLGQSVLQQFGSVYIDYERGQIVLE